MMKRPTTILLLFVLLSACAPLRTQPTIAAFPGADEEEAEEGNPSGLGPLVDFADVLDDAGVMVRGSTSKVSVLKDDPAKLQIQDPTGDGNTTSIVDAAITWEIIPETNEKWTWGPTVEYHKNTNVGKKQNTFSAGLLLRYQLGSITEGTPGQDLRPGSGWFIQGEGKFKDDHVANSDGLTISVSAMPFLAGWMQVPTPYNRHNLQFSPEIGLVYEEASGGTADGDVTRAFVSGDLTYYPAARQIYDRWNVHINAKYWNDITQSGTFDGTPDDNRLVKVGTTYYLDIDQHFGITVEHVNGADPLASLPDQEYVLLSLAVKF